MQILIGLHRIVSAFDKLTSDIVADYGVTFSQFMVLEALYTKGDMTIGQVRDNILSSAGTISLIVNNLEKQKYIERLSNARDRRVCILHLTKRGHNVISQIVPQNNAMISDVMATLDKKEQASLQTLLKKLGGKLNEKRSEN